MTLLCALCDALQQLKARIALIPDVRTREMLAKIATNPAALETMSKVTAHALDKGYLDPKTPTQPPSMMALMRDPVMIALLQEMMAQLTSAGISTNELPLMMKGLFASKFGSQSPPPLPTIEEATIVSQSPAPGANLAQAPTVSSDGATKPSLTDRLKSLFK